MRFFKIPSPIVLEVSGHDSQRYLHARLSNDIKALAPGAGCFAAALTPQGKIQALFSVFVLAERRYLVIADGGDHSDVVAAFKKYLVADRVEVSDVSADRALFHLLPDKEGEISAFVKRPPSLAAEFSFTSDGGSFASARTRGDAAGVDLLVPASSEAELRRALAAGGAAELDLESQLLTRLRGNRPAFPQEILPDTLVAEAPLESAISHTKGCYVGQEVVEKIDSRGKAPHRMTRLVFEGCPEIRAGDKVSRRSAEAREELGAVVRSAADKESRKTYCFAVLKNRNLESGSEVEVNGIRAVIS